VETNVHSIKSSIRSAVKYLTELGVPDPRPDAEILLAFTLGVPREKLVSADREPLPEKMRLKFNRLIARRGDRREPVAYIVGSAGFFGLEFSVSPSVLIPRPATETLVELALERLPKDGTFADIGTGSGAIAIAVLTKAARAEAVATDLSERALDVARRNARAIGVSQRLDVRQGDLYEPLGTERFDLVVSNPPYVREDDFDGLAPELRHEPRAALVAGADGLGVVRRLVEGARDRLKEGGRLLLEIGAGQAERVRDLAFHAGFRVVQFKPDLEGVDRVMEAC